MKVLKTHAWLFFLIVCWILQIAWHTGSARAMNQRTSQQNSLSLQEIIQRVHQHNTEIIISDIGQSLARKKIVHEQAIFEPQLLSSSSYDDRHIPTDAETAASLSSLLTWQNLNATEQNDYASRTASQSFSIQQLLPTGGSLTLGTSFQIRDNDQIEANYPDVNKPEEYQTVFSAELSQPLLKGAWTKVTLAGIEIAKTDLALAQQSYRKKMMQVIFQAIENYWQLYAAQQNLSMQQEAVQLTSQLLEESKHQVQAGKMAKTELLQLRSGLIKRKRRVGQARQHLLDVENRLRNTLSETVISHPSPIRVTGKSKLHLPSLQLQAMIKQAYAKRPERLVGILQAKRLKTQIIVAENNRLPQLDLQASLQRNGLDTENEESIQQILQENYTSWSIGLELSIPLAGGMKSRSELESLQMQKRQALLRIQKAEIAIANSVQTHVNNVQNAREDMQLSQENVQLMEDLLALEIEKLKTGHTTSRKVLLREEDCNRAGQALLESQTQYQLSLAQLSLAQGSLLEHFNLDVEEFVDDL